MIDTHAHLDAQIYETDLDHIVQRAQDDGITIVTVGNDYESSLNAIRIAERYPNVYAAVGLHPKKVRGDSAAPEKLLDIKSYIPLLTHPKVVALGECGLDYRNLPTSASSHDPEFFKADLLRRNQQTVLRGFLLLAREYHLPLLVHCQDAHDDLLRLLTEWETFNPGFTTRGIIHAFNGTWDQAKKYFQLDFIISLTGIITHGAYQTEIIRKAPLSRLVVESDCPHLVPNAWNHRRSEPSYITHTVTALAGLRGMPTSSFAVAVTENTKRMLKKVI